MKSGGFPQGARHRRLARRLEDPELREQFEREQREIAQIDALIKRLDALRAIQGMSKAALAREIHKNPAVVRRRLTAPANPELRTVSAPADALDADVLIVPRKRSTRGRLRTQEVCLIDQIIRALHYVQRSDEVPRSAKPLPIWFRDQATHAMIMPTSGNSPATT